MKRSLALFLTAMLVGNIALADDEQHHQHAGAAAASHTEGSGMYGPYDMTRESTGSSWQPDSTPMEAIHFQGGQFSFMLHGFFDIGFQDEPIPRGGNEVFATSMFMFSGVRPAGGGRVGFRFMTSLEPVMGSTGYPLLFQTGETADGVTPLVDRQHPHDLMMEMAATYSFDVARDSSWFVYFAPVGEPALGPPAFMHRSSSGENPLAPISHHWLDSTHISYGVLTTGFNVASRVNVEGSFFNGHEPDEARWNVEPFGLNSYAGRVSVNPTENWSFQASFAQLDEPEALHPGIDVFRLTASGTYNRRLASGNWQTLVAWGRNEKSQANAAVDVTGLLGHTHGGQTPLTGVVTPSAVQNAVLAESSLRFDRYNLFGRFEWTQKDELFAPDDPRHNLIFDISKINVGITRELLGTRPVGLLGGVAVGSHLLPLPLSLEYGKRPMTLTFFMRIKIR